jgi:hypothetical protein
MQNHPVPQQKSNPARREPQSDVQRIGAQKARELERKSRQAEERRGQRYDQFSVRSGKQR